MKDFDNIEDWYREELDKFNVEPDKNVWDSLSDDLDADMTLTDENIGEWYKREVSKLEERPDYTVWEKLATKLDTASVWDKLVVSLNRYDQYIWWRNVIIKGSSILLLLGASYLTYDNYFGDNKSDNNAVVVENSNANQELGTINSSAKSNTPVAAELIKNEVNNSTPTTSMVDNNFSAKSTDESISIAESINDAKRSLASKSNDATFESSTTYASLNNIPKEIYFNSVAKNRLDELKTNEELDIVEIERRNITERDISHIYSSVDFLVKKEKNKIVFNSKRFSSYFTYGLYARRFYIGVNAGVKKQGLITSLRKDGPLSSFNQVDYLDFGNNFGITAGYIVSDKFNIEANLNVVSTSGYKRKFNGEGASIDEELNLNYTTLNLLGKKMNTKSTFDNKVYSTNLIGGVYASILNSSSSNLNGNQTENNSFKNTDFGIVLGIEQDRYISKTLIVTPGVRFNQGLTNIANETSSFSSARNFSLEFNLGVKYIFLKKSK